MPPRDPRRPDRVAAAIREEVAAFLSHGLRDPRATGLLTVTAVEVTRDLRHATIFVSVLGGGDVPVLSVWFESLLKARAVQDALLQRGVFVEALPARGLRRNGAVLRVLVSASHSPQEVERLVDGFAEVFRRGALDQ